MKIKFEESRQNGYLEYFAISNMEMYRGKIHDELLWAELRPLYDGVEVRWEDSWSKPEVYVDIASAKANVEALWSKHTPHNNGCVYETDEV